jgi:hypothetical protein
MAFEALLAFAGAVLSGGLAIFALLANPRLFVHRIFASGMSALVLAQICAGMGAQAVLLADIVHWEYLRLLSAAFIPGTWLLFSVHFACANASAMTAQWRWVILVSFVLPVILVIACQHALFTAPIRIDAAFGWVLPLGWAGYGFSLCSLLISVVILMHCERILRASTGSMRWQIKFMLLGLGSAFAAQIYTDSQVLLFFSTTRRLNVFTSWAVIVANIFIIGSFVRHRFLSVDIYLSRTVVHNSLTVILVGGYLFTVGVLANLIKHFGWDQTLPLGTFFVFVASVTLTLVVLSEQLRQKLQQLISRHFYRARYDYRQKWTLFTECTTSVVDVKELCAAVTKMVSEGISQRYRDDFVESMLQFERLISGQTTFDDLVQNTFGGITPATRDRLYQRHSRARRRLFEWVEQDLPALEGLLPEQKQLVRNLVAQLRR